MAMQIRPASRLVLAPFFTTAIFILNALRNKLQIFSPDMLSITIFTFTAFIFSLLCFYAALFFLNDRIKGGILSSFALVLSLGYFDIYYTILKADFIKKALPEIVIFKFHYILIGLFLIALFFLFRMLRKMRRDLQKVNIYFNIIFFLFLMIETYRLISYKKFEVTLKDAPALKIGDKKGLPKRNIYYIVLDAYTSSDALKKYWGYDNCNLENFLVGKGFFIAGKSNSNYNSTPFSVASSLNMSYLNIEDHKEAQRVNISQVYSLVENGRVAEELSTIGYTFKNLSFLKLHDAAPFYDDPFYGNKHLFDRTIFFLVTEKLGITQEHRKLMKLSDMNSKIFSELTAATGGSPSFCYAHIMMPHYPYFFDEAGNLMSEEYARSETKRKEKYLEQLKYTNKLLMKTVEHILSISEEQPVIIIQGDHGFRDLHELPLEEQLQESNSIFSAYYFPSVQAELYDSISPVNTFRVMFNSYFDSYLPLLEDTSFNTEIPERK